MVGHVGQHLRKCSNCAKDCPPHAFTRSQIRKRGKRARCRACTASPAVDEAGRMDAQRKAQSQRPWASMRTSSKLVSEEADHGESRLSEKLKMCLREGELGKGKGRVPSPTSVAEHPAMEASKSSNSGPVLSKEESDRYSRKCTALLHSLYREGNGRGDSAKEAVVEILMQYEGRENVLWEKLVAYEDKLKSKASTPASRCDGSRSRKRERQWEKKPVDSADPNCDRCDGEHESTKCPFYKKPRGNHPDEQRSRGLGMASAGGNHFVPFRQARVRQQPGDGSCLYHSMCFGLRQRCRSARALRKELATWVRSNQHHIISNTKLSEWIRWDSGKNVHAYAAQMMRGSWGGAIEMVACSKLYNCNIHVYQAHRGKRAYKRISCFNSSRARHTVNVLYQGGVHYDALIIK